MFAGRCSPQEHERRAGRVSCYVSFCDSYTATAPARRKPCATSPDQKQRSTGGGWGEHPGASGASFLRGRAVSDRCPQKWRSRAEDGTLLVLVQEARHPGHGHLTLGAWARRGGDGASGVTGRGCPRLPVPFLGCREALQKNLGKLPRNSCGRFWTNLGKRGKASREVACFMHRDYGRW